ncbi:hypothetical protein F4802DRAFT_490270 [Xylaria palmicola]|nr:hypothetical protein F4802DRAFT_490270 [Xylaria palmicola]
MRHILPFLLGGAMAFSVDNRDHKARSLDMVAGGYDKHPRTYFETANGTSPAPPAFGSILTTKNECNNGMVDCSDYQCDECGSCCGGGKCAENFGNCCSEDTHCSFGFSCCGPSGGCCYEDTSFCCDSSPTGCCVKGTQCTPDGCVGDPAFLVESVTVTTTLTSVIYYTSTIVDTTVATNLGVTTKFVTSTVTRDNVDIATVTNYITSTKIAKRFLPENYKRAEYPVERRNRPAPPTPPAPMATHGLEALRVGLGNIGLLQKRDVTSYIYDFVFVWDTYSSGIIETSTVASEVASMSTLFSTITSTLFRDAKSTTTVVSTVVVTSTQVTTSPSPDSFTTSRPTDPDTTKPSNDIVIETTFVGGVTGSGDGEAVTGTPVADGGGASGLQVVTGVPTTASRGDDSSARPTTAAPTGSSTPPANTGKQSELSTGAKAGIGAGAGAAAIALLGALVFFALGKRRRAKSATSGDNSRDPTSAPAVTEWMPPPPPSPPNRYSHLDSREVSYTERAAALARSMENMGKPTSTPSIPGYNSSLSPSLRGASPSVPSEMMGYESPRGGLQEMGGTAENMGWHVGAGTEHHEMRGHHYHEMPAPPVPDHYQHHSHGHAW